MARVIALPRRLDTAACTELHAVLIAHRHAPIDLDGTATDHIGAVGAQLLLAAFRSWSDPSTFRITDLQQSALLCLAELGITPEQIGAARAEVTR